jgi:hypothetical protein
LVSVEGTCTCGVNAAGTAYCEPFPGDPAGVHLIEVYKEFIEKKHIEACNTRRRYSIECVMSSPFPDKEELALAALLYENYPQLLNNDPCVKRVINNKYWEFSSAVVLAASVALLLG